MPRIEADQPLIPSVLDRLLDEQPDATRDATKTRAQALRELKQSLRRDLENLLNTRWMCAELPEDLEELDLSLMNYGIPDITGANLGYAKSRTWFREMLERAVRRFEPRFRNVTVEVLDNVEPLDRSLRFRIEALLEVDPAPEPVAFDSVLRPVSGDVEVKGTSR